MKTIKKLPQAELDVMLALWQAPGPVYRSYFDQTFQQGKNWTDSTILSLLARLTEKGFIQTTKQGNRNLYRPLVKKQDYLAVENQSFLEKLHGNSLRHLVASMADAHELSATDLDELEDLIQTLKKEE